METHTEHYQTYGIDRQTIHHYCQTVMDQAMSGDDLADAARLLVGSEMAESGFGETLRRRIIERVKTLNEANNPVAAAKEAHGIGEAMMILRGAISN